MHHRYPIFIFCFCLMVFAVSCKPGNAEQAADTSSSLVQGESRIVSLNGTLTEMLCAFGFENNIVGTDVTSTYPPAMQHLPKVGHNRNISSEGIISLQPHLVMGIEDDVDPEVREQIKTAGIQSLWLSQEYSVEDTESLIRALADTLGIPEKTEAMIQQIREPLTQLATFEEAPKVLFIYARGAGTLLAAGQKTSVDQMIQLAGGVNAVQGFDDYKPLTAEALVAANPDAILLFSSGLQSLEGPQGLLDIPGIAQTNAGKNKAFISMDGQYLAGFGPRLGQAVFSLNQQLYSLLHSPLSSQ